MMTAGDYLEELESTTRGEIADTLTNIRNAFPTASERMGAIAFSILVPLLERMTISELMEVAKTATDTGTVKQTA